jgi:dTMP kinase
MRRTESFIVIDGCEGAGKSTQVRLLAEHFGDRVLITREPGGSPYAEEIRNVILNSPHAGGADARTMFALFWAARADHLRHTILPALEAGKTVITDRFDSTTFMYQLYGQEARELEELFWVMRKEYVEEHEPDLYIFFDIEPGEALSRKKKNDVEMNHFDERELSFHKRVREGMNIFSKKVTAQIIDGGQSINDVQKELRGIIENYVHNETSD